MKHTDTSPATIEKLLHRGVVDCVVRTDLEAKLASGTPLRIKLGIDPTKPDLHLGHAVPLRKLRQFQDAGHTVVLLFGGFTATIGDPTGKNEARPPLTAADVQANAAEYLRQAGKILDLDNLEVVNNHDWLGQFTPADFVRLLSSATVAQMLERDMFVERQKKGEAIYCHEILYPLLQGYDSVAIKADVEIGGTDQLFNLLAGRPLQREAGQVPQNVLTVPLIEGLDGTQKMSKSLGNYIGLDDAPADSYGKLMRLPDALMAKYAEVFTDWDLETFAATVASDPRGAKGTLAKEIVAFVHGADAAVAAEQDFVQKFVKKDMTADMPVFDVAEGITLTQLLVDVTQFAKSTSEVRRLVQGGAVSINGEKITDHAGLITVSQAQRLKSVNDGLQNSTQFDAQFQLSKVRLTAPWFNG